METNKRDTDDCITHVYLQQIGVLKRQRCIKWNNYRNASNIYDET